MDHFSFSQMSVPPGFQQYNGRNFQHTSQSTTCNPEHHHECYNLELDYKNILAENLGSQSNSPNQDQAEPLTPSSRILPNQSILKSPITNSQICYDGTTAAANKPGPIMNAALKFEPTSSDGYVSINCSKMFTYVSGGSISIMVWVKTTQTTGEITILGANFPTNYLYLKIVDNKYVFGTFAPSASGRSTARGAPLAPAITVEAPIIEGDHGHWVHICGRYDSKTRIWSIVRNGFELAAARGSGYIATDTTWYLGGYPSNVSVPSAVEFRDLCVVASAVSLTSLREIFMRPRTSSGSFGPPDEGTVVACWPLNDNVDTTLKDISTTTPAASISFSNSNISWASGFTVRRIRFVTHNDYPAVLTLGPFSSDELVTIFIGPGDYNMRMYVAGSNISVVGCGELTEVSAPCTRDSIIGAVNLQNVNDVILRQFHIISYNPNMWDLDDTIRGVFGLYLNRFYMDHIHVLTLDHVQWRYAFHVVAEINSSSDVRITNSSLRTATTDDVGHTTLGGGLICNLGTTIILNNTLIEPGKKTSLAAGVVMNVGCTATLNNCNVTGTYCLSAYEADDLIIANNCILVGGNNGNGTIIINPKTKLMRMRFKFKDTI